MNQQPLFVHVPSVRQLRESAPAEGGSVEALKVTQTILPDILDKIHGDFVATCSESLLRKFNGRLERALLLAKEGKVQVTDQPGIFNVRGTTGPQCWYEVDLNERICECPDHNAGNICKHRTAAWYIQQALFRDAPDPGVEDEVEPVVEQADSVRGEYAPCESIIYARLQPKDSINVILVEVLDTNSAHQQAFVQALPKFTDEGEMIPQFPFSSEFEDSLVKYSTTWVDYDNLSEVKIYRSKGE